MKKKYILLLSIASGVLIGCTPVSQNSETPPAGVQQILKGTDQTDSPEPLMEASDAEQTTEATITTEGEATEITIDMFNFGYSEERLAVSPGESLEITLTNSQGNHDFDIDELNIDTEVISQGETNTVTVTIPEDAQTGTEYAYYCSVGNHRTQGMEGTIVVE